MRIRIQPIKVPKSLINTSRLMSAVETALDGAAAAVKVDFDVTTQTWDDRPEFTIEKPQRFERLIGTDNKIYGFLDHGTRKNYPIRPRPENKSGLLVFQTGYKAKTRTKWIGSSSGGKYGPTVATTGVIHPGIEKREFSKEIAKKWDKLFPHTIQRAIDSVRLR